MQNLKAKINNVSLKAYITVRGGAKKLSEKLREKDGSFFVDHALTIIIIVVIAALFLASLYVLFKDKIFPNLENKADDFFNYQ